MLPQALTGSHSRPHNLRTCPGNKRWWGSSHHLSLSWDNDNGHHLPLNFWLQGPAMTQGPAGLGARALAPPAFILMLTQERLDSTNLTQPSLSGAPAWVCPHDHLAISDGF